MPGSEKSKGVVLEWSDIVYEVPVQDPKDKSKKISKTILSRVSGNATPGTLTLLMGPSGAGKTSLLRLLSGRVPLTSGSLRVNGKPPSLLFRRLHGFVDQEVPMYGTLTVREILTFMARLKMPESAGMEAVRSKVEDTIKLLDLEKCKDTYSSMASGGERRRLMVGAELLGDPPLLFLDEPTTGLDGTSALNVMEILRRLAHEGNRTIICTIHQPRASLLPIADRLILLADGRQVYAGPTWTSGRRDGLLSYFAGLGFPSPPFENPADHIVDIVNKFAPEEEDGEGDIPKGAGSTAAVAAAAADEEGGTAIKRMGSEEAGPVAVGAAAMVADPEVAERSVKVDGPMDVAKWKAGSEASEFLAKPAVERIKAAHELRDAKSRKEFIDWMTEQFGESDLLEKIKEPIAESELPADPLESEDGSGRKSRFPTSCFTQCSVICQQMCLYKARDPEAVASVFLGTVALAVIIGLVYLSLPLTSSGMRDRLAYITMFFLTIAFAPFDLVLLFPKERKIFVRDTNANLYGTVSYYTGRTLAELPVHVTFAVLSGVVSYYMVGLQPAADLFGMHLLVLAALMWCSTSIFIAVSAVSADFASANGLATIVLVFAMLFSGIFVTQDNTPEVFRWIGDISFLRLGVEAASIVELRTLSVQCGALDLTCVSSGTDLLRQRGFGTEMSTVWWNLLWIFVQGLVFRIFSLFGVHFCFTGQSCRERTRLICE